VNRSLHRFVDEQPIVTNGRFARSLYLDTFYVDQPTIAFQGCELKFREDSLTLSERLHPDTDLLQVHG
jgi:hypothetical protein